MRGGLDFSIVFVAVRSLRPGSFERCRVLELAHIGFSHYRCKFYAVQASETFKLRNRVLVIIPPAIAMSASYWPEFAAGVG